MSRPKGIIQKRNEQKYWLPEGVSLLPNQDNNYRKETKLWFVDNVYGSFQSSFKALQQANASTHPLAVQIRREETNKAKYGGINPHCSKDVVNKSKQTMKQRYGVEHALQNPEFLQKAKETLEFNHNVSHPMYSFSIKQKLKQSIQDKYGVSNVMQVDSIKEKVKKTSLERYGTNNPSQNPEVIEKILKNKSTKTSIGENEVKSFIQNELKVNCESSYIGGSSPKQLDIFIKQKNIAIEYNGTYWHSEANPRIHKNYHLEKMNSCKIKNIKLIQIFDFEWKNKKQQVQSFIRSALGCNEIKLNARELALVKYDKNNKTVKNFLNEWHILGGNNNFEVAYGLIDNNHGLVSVITIGKHHRNNTENVLTRYCGKGNITVRVS